MPQAYATIDEVRELAPELEDVDDAIVTLWLDIAATFIGLDRWGVRASYGHALLAAHFITIGVDGQAGEAGVVVSEANGPASRSFAAPPAPTDPELGTTNYGRIYITLRRIVRGWSGFVVGGGSL